MVGVIGGGARMGAVAHAVMRRVAVTDARTNAIPVAGVSAPGTVPVRVVAGDHRVFDVGGAVIAMMGGIGVASAVIAVMIRATTSGSPAGYRPYLPHRPSLHV